MGPKRHVQVLTARTYACEFIWKDGLCRCDGAKSLEVMCPRLGVTLNPMTSALRRRGEDTGGRKDT